MLEKWTKTSSPCSREMKPNPFSALKNFTVPCATNTRFSSRRANQFGPLADMDTIQRVGQPGSELRITPVECPHAIREANRCDQVGPVPQAVPRLPGRGHRGLAAVIPASAHAEDPRQ